jgi:arylsulfatase A
MFRGCIMTSSPLATLTISGLLSVFVAICFFPFSICDASPPNIILVLADDLGYSDLGCYGNRFNETPNIDRLAAGGLRFTQFYAGPVCSPTRANLQSGLDQARFGITQHIPGHRRPFAKLLDPVVPHELPLDVVTFAERLNKAGYKTGYFGKWHLGGQGFTPGDQGWQVFEETHGHVMKGGESRKKKKQTKEISENRTTSHLTEKAIEFILSNKEQPFLLQVSHNAVHIPLSTTDSLRAKYQAKAAVPGYPSNPEYAGLLEELDASVGAIVKTLEEAGLAERTLIVFLSDNGGLEHQQDGTIVTSNLPLRQEKGTLYEGGIRIPSIWYWPKQIIAGKTSDTLATTIDIAATFTELAGALFDVPTDGVSLTGVLLTADSQLSRDALYWHLPHYHHSTPASAIRKGDWKLIEFLEDSSLELYNLRSDPSESENLASKETTLAQKMLHMLQQWRQKVNARMPTLNPDYDPSRKNELAKGKG